MISERLALGTVQFGLDYGISNSTGQVTQQNAKDILETAQQAGIMTLDTAAAYGTAETVLGLFAVDKFQVITKFVPSADETPTIATAQTHLYRSLKRLNRNKLYGLLIHDPAILLSPGEDAVFAGLERVKANGLVEKIGVSAYAPEEINTLSARYALDLVQVPLNPLDARWDRTLQELAADGIEIHIRSLFLQGVLLMSYNKLPDFLSRHRPLIRKWHTWCQDNNISQLTACLRLFAPQAARNQSSCWRDKPNRII